MAKMVDLREHNGWFHFRWKGDGWGTESDFQQTLKELKERIPIQDRSYNAEADHEWGVRAANEYEDVLCDLFHNAKSTFTAMRSQLSLF